MWAACSPVAEASHAAFKPMEYKVFVEPLRNLDLFFQTSICAGAWKALSCFLSYTGFTALAEDTFLVFALD